MKSRHNNVFNATKMLTTNKFNSDRLFDAHRSRWKNKISKWTTNIISFY